MRWRAALALLVAPVPALAAPAAVPDAAFVVLGENGQPTARLITAADRCPDIVIDGRASPMTVRAAPATLPLRPTLSTAENSKASAFPVLTCDAALPGGTRRAAIGGHRLPPVSGDIRRIVVIGDTGCRLKAADNAYQDCNDPAAFPFARIAARAAAWHPQLVVHVGDYHYRENPCVADKANCTGSPWGYGWDAWNADLFTPGVPLFAAAPWVVVRGNHENCARAGQGWWRLLDPRPLAPQRDCNQGADDAIGDAASVYTVPLGEGARIIVADLATAPDKALTPDDPRFGQFTFAYEAILAASRGSRFSFVATHKPILGITATKQDRLPDLKSTSLGTQSAFSARDTNILPPSVDVVLSGHVHLWEQVSYAGRYPSQFITGFSGTVEDVVPLPKHLPVGYAPVSAGIVDAFSSWVDGFGYMTLERRSTRRWLATVRDVNGKPVNTCAIDGRLSKCRVAKVGERP